MKAPVSDDLRSEIQQLRLEGLSYARIAKRLGIAATTARKYGGSTNEPPKIYDLEKINEQAQRCPECGRKVLPPCRACEHENRTQEETSS